MCRFELTATPDTSPKWRSGGGFRKSTLASTLISGTGVCPQTTTEKIKRNSDSNKSFISDLFKLAACLGVGNWRSRHQKSTQIDSQNRSPKPQHPNPNPHRYFL